MLSADLGSGDAAARVPHASQRRGGDGRVAAQSNIAIMGELQHDEADPRPSFVSAPLAPNDAPNVLAPAALILLLALLAGVTLDDVVWFGILGQVPEVPRLVIGITSFLIGARIIFQGRAVLRRTGMHFVLYRPSLALARARLPGRGPVRDRALSDRLLDHRRIGLFACRYLRNLCAHPLGAIARFDDCE